MLNKIRILFYAAFYFKQNNVHAKQSANNFNLNFLHVNT